MSYQPLNIGTRAYKYIRSGAVKSIPDALVELITNCHDAYNRDSSLQSPYDICVKCYFERKNKIYKIKVIDQAIGLSGDDLESKFLSVGNYTSSRGTRGFFSRGAKDISNIADIQFDAIINNKYSSIQITNEGLGRVVSKDVDVTDEIRNEHNITNNGFSVTMNILEPFRRMYPNQLKNNIRDHWALRDILKDNKYNVRIQFFEKTNERDNEYRIQFVEDNTRQLLVDADFYIPSYDDAPANLKIYATSSSNCDKGILVKSDTTIYTKTCFERKLINHPYMKKITGVLTCNKIHDLLYDFDENGSSTKNPYCIIDHSRGGGIIKSHPFAKELYNYPSTKLNQILHEMEDAERSILTTESNDIADLIDKLNIIGEQFELGGTRQYSWRKEETGKIIKAVDGNRDIYVNVEKNFRYEPPLPLGNTENNNKAKSGSGSSKPVATIYEKDDSGELKKLALLESGSLVDYNEVEGSMYQTPAIKRFNINFSNAENPNQRYDIYETTEEVVLSLYTNEPIVQSYLGSEPDSSTLTTEKGKTFLSETVIEAFATIMTKNEMELDAEEYDTLNTTDMLSTYKEIYNRNVQSIESLIKNAIDSYN